MEQNPSIYASNGVKIIERVQNLILSSTAMFTSIVEVDCFAVVCYTSKNV